MALQKKLGRVEFLRYRGANFFRLRVVLATLFQRPLYISDIRCDATNPGLRKYEANLLRLIDKVSDGATFHIDVTGTELRYTPGRLTGGSDLIHDCGTERNISYFLEALLFLAPFASRPLSIRLKGITNGSCCDDGTYPLDPSVDLFRSVIPPLMARLGMESDALSISVTKRGLYPLGKGEVEFSCPVLRKVNPVQLVEEGRVKRVRGLAFTSQVSPQFAVRMIDRARWVLNDFLPDVWVYNVASKPGKDGPSPGYGITLIAETMKGHMKGVDLVIDDVTRDRFHKALTRAPAGPDLASYSKVSVQELLRKDSAPVVKPQLDHVDESTSLEEKVQLSEQELVGVVAAQRLLLEIHQGGVTGTAFQHIPLLFMAMAEEHQVCKVKLCRLTPYTVQFLRHLKDFASVTFSFDQEEVVEGGDPNEDYGFHHDADESSESADSDEKPLSPVPQIILKCIGIGYKNIGKPTF